MPLGNTSDIHIVIEGRILENVKDHSILGIILNKHLKFYKEVDFALGRAKKTFGKMAYLLQGFVGICQNGAWYSSMGLHERPKSSKDGKVPDTVPKTNS